MIGLLLAGLEVAVLVIDQVGSASDAAPAMEVGVSQGRLNSKLA